MQKNILRALFISTALLVIPFSASFLAEGWLWTMSDYVLAWLLFSLVSLGFTFIVHSAKNAPYKAAAGIAIVGTFLLVWVNGAVGIIGDSDANLFYALVVFTLFIGAILSRLKPLGMSYTLFAAALVQAFIPIIAFIINTPDFTPGVALVFLLNFFWAALFTGSAFLFRRANALEVK